MEVSLLKASSPGTSWREVAGGRQEKVWEEEMAEWRSSAAGSIRQWWIPSLHSQVFSLDVILAYRHGLKIFQTNSGTLF